MLRKLPSYWVCQILGWIVVVLFLIFYSFAYHGEIKILAIYRYLLVGCAGILTTHLLRSYIKYQQILLLPIGKAIRKIIFVFFVSVFLFSIIIELTYDLFGLHSTVAKYDFWGSLLVNSFGAASFMIPWILIYYSYHYVIKIRNQEIDTLKLFSLLKELELKTIKSHINPHFIFNSLNGIRALIQENPSRAKTSINQLVNILRNSTIIEKLETVEFGIELGIVKDYLALEHIRFEERLNVIYEIDDKTLKLPVPPMMLQTLTENAIKHGISKLMQGGTIKIHSRLRLGFHELNIENSGVFGNLIETGFGISSTKKRLELLFGKNASFDIRSLNDGKVIVQILIPVHAMELV